MKTEYPKDPSPIKELLNQSSFASIVQKAQLLLKIEQILSGILPEDFREHCRVMNLKEETLGEKTLVIEVDNSAIATRLRYQENELINQMRDYAELKLVKRIQFHIRPRTED